MNLENLKHLPEIVQFMDKVSQENFEEIYAPQFETNIFVEEILYPEWVKDWDDTEEHLSQLKLDIMTPIETLIQKAGLSSLSKEDLDNGDNYYYIYISFGIKPLPKFKGFFKQDAVNIFLVPFVDEDGNNQVKILSPEFSFGVHFQLLMGAELLNLNPIEERKIHQLKALTEAIEVICNKFKIKTEHNNGNFVELKKEDPEKLLEEFLEITHAKDFNDEEVILDFKHHWNLIQTNPEEYKEILVDEGYFDEDAEIDTHYFTQYLLSDFLCAYDTDWKMDHEELSEFISEEIGQDFNITYEETLQKPSVIVEKLEAESNYTMLNIDTQMDSYSFFICKKEEKEKILKLARKLNFPIEENF